MNHFFPVTTSLSLFSCKYPSPHRYYFPRILTSFRYYNFQVAKAARLEKFELPAKINLIPESWTPETGLVTAALKLKREPLKARYKNELEKLYQWIILSSLPSYCPFSRFVLLLSVKHPTISTIFPVECNYKSLFSVALMLKQLYTSFHMI